MNNTCIIDGCGKQQGKGKKGYCSAHYERIRVHGSPFIDNRAGRKVAFVKCKVVDCQKEATHKGQMLCMLHYGRWFRHGSTDSKLPTYGQGVHIHEQGYRMLRGTDGKYRMEHVVKAEKALGKPLPAGAVVHHMNNNVLDNDTPFNLVICPDQSYHMLLHRRMKEYAHKILLEEMSSNDKN